MAGESREALSSRAARYATVRYILAIIDIAYLAALLVIFLALGASLKLSSAISRINPNSAIVFLLYLAALLAIYSLLEFPLNFYRSFVVEHRFGLSRQKFQDWFLDQLKSAGIAYIIAAVTFGAFYYLLRRYPATWWVMAAAFWLFFNLILAKIFPLVILPLFFKYRRLTDENLKQRILELAKKLQLRIVDVFEIDFSRKTHKANAALAGWGSSRRVILADTLKDKYTNDEIAVILAHELSHYKLRHLFKIAAINSATTLLAFYLIFRGSTYLTALFGLGALTDIASLPLIILCLVLFGIIAAPLENYFSRRMERNADRLALKTVGDKEAFIATMDKLASQNLADRKPHPVIKFFFFDHPPIDERIEMARNF